MNVAPLLETVEGTSVDETFGPTTVDVPLGRWRAAATAARDLLDCRYFDFLTAVDQAPGTELVCHVARLDPFDHVVLRTVVPGEEQVPTLEPVWAGAAWHEREVAEMFGVGFVADDGTTLVRPPLLLPPDFEGHPLRKDFALQAREDTPWPGDA